jgi:hypothetical protein
MGLKYMSWGCIVVKLDLKRELKALYGPTKDKVTVVEVPELRYLMIDGQGDPNTSTRYREAIETLYPVAYTLKFMLKAEGLDMVVMPLEGLWWAADMGSFLSGDRDAWCWTSMILQPDEVAPALVTKASEQARAKRNPPLIDELRLESYREGKAAQILHIGPYADEAPTIERLHRHIEELGGELRGKHHEIYLSDPKRTAPEKLKTVIRQPFA